MSSDPLNVISCAQVIGGGGGIGKAIAEYLITRGKNVILAGRTDANLAATAHEIGASAYYLLDVGVVTDIRGPMHLTKRFLSHLRAKPHALIINLTSIVAFVPFRLVNPGYNGTKAWLHSWTVILRTALDRAGANIRAVEIVPPTVGTDLHREAPDPDNNKKDKNPAALTVEEVIEEVVVGLVRGGGIIGAGPSVGVVKRWYRDFEGTYEAMMVIK
ncbi:NAD(P)-binding protein [Aspergillus ellipticus CBS 707.79]|uniref:NAD(P)-binding protein n=1 Tax=Aspergillus ellipticus CBS 707.79 TaxID=1448320 RepID=A0A319DDY0_9EURO|nr:NAD(P)-binding protein [Aspergillus ellipticus CBS 707.79]